MDEVKKIKKVLVLGSGALKIGQAGEFDYSGSQALKALKEEKIESILINPNIATIQTSARLADKIYFLPVTYEFVKRVIKKEKPEGVLLGFGGQTALNCGLELAQKGVFKKFNVSVLGTPIEAIEETEDRAKFVIKLKEINLLTPKSQLATSLKEAEQAAKKIGFPLILRVGFALGGLGSAVVKNLKDFAPAVSKALSRSPQALVEEYLGGWKEVEYEVVRDKFDNCLTVCSMENIDPMGIHTGESIVIAPTQTLSAFEYFFLRDKAIRLIRHLNIVGECNIQFAVNPEKFDYRIIEVNARLSRSSALASKATGYPLAFVATKLALGKGLYQIKNSVTKVTTAFFEPALDYVVIKFPRWDLDKFKDAYEKIGTEMKSVGEVMAIGRNFQECLQKSIRMLACGWDGLINPSTQEYFKLSEKELIKRLHIPTSKRIFMIAAAILKNISLEEINQITKIDPFFLEEIKKICDFYQQLKTRKKLTSEILREAKILGFSDEQIAQVFKSSFSYIRKLRKKWQIFPQVKQIDTLAAEFPARVNYLYLTYQGTNSDLNKMGTTPKKAIILGSGPYCIGSSVEFDWCAVNAAIALKKHGFSTLMINCNPETVSTDFDVCDRLYFEELTLERVLDICDEESPEFLVLSFGGQIANNLAEKLASFKLKILGTKALYIDIAEDRKKFSAVLDRLEIRQPDWQSFYHLNDAIFYAERIGYPVLVRPSYVLSGAAMFVAYNRKDLEAYLARSIRVSQEYPLVVTKFIEEAKEIEIDGVGQRGNLVVYAIGEHVEYAGAHSGDATIVVPPQRIYLQTLGKIKKVSRKIVKALRINGPFNIQFLAKNNEILVIECNLRASRSFPFVSKVVGINFIDLAIRTMLGEKIRGKFNTLDLDYVGVKSPQFSFNRLAGADPILRVEMASTGEVACLDKELLGAYLKSLLAVDFTLPKKKILLSLGGMENKIKFLKSAKALKEAGFILLATDKTHLFLKEYQIENTKVFKEYEGKKPSVVDLIKKRAVDLVINLSEKPDKKSKINTFEKEITDGYLIRRAAADFQIPLLTNLQNAKLFVEALRNFSLKQLEIEPWSFYTKNVF